MSVADELKNDVAEKACAAADASKSWARQLRWVAGELARAVEHPDYPVQVGRIADVFDQEAIEAYLALAAHGELRARPVRNPSRASLASMRVRWRALSVLASAAGVPVELPRAPRDPGVLAPVAPRPRGLLRDRLEDAADRFGAGPERVRLLALMGVVLETRARAGELCALVLDDVAPDLSRVRLVRRRQGAKPGEEPDRAEVFELSLSTRAALRRWLRVRQALVAEVQGACDALWVSVWPNHNGQAATGTRARPPGMPLQPRGLARAYTRAVEDANIAFQGSVDWEPLPQRLEQLRRGGDVRAEESVPVGIASDQLTARLLGSLDQAASALAAASGDDALESEEALRARIAMREAAQRAWRIGVSHRAMMEAAGGAVAMVWDQALVNAIRAAG